MPTKTAREEIHELIKQNYNENTARCVVALAMPVFDALLEEARQEAREEMKKKTLNLVGDLISQKKGLGYFEPKSIQELVAIESIIQSL